MHRPEVAGGGRKWIVLCEIDRKAQKILELLFRDDNEVDQTQGIQLAPGTKQNSLGRFFHPLVRR